MDILYRSGRQGLKVRGLTLLALAVLAGTCYAAWQIAISYGLAPADGGQLRPLWQRLSLAAFIVALALAFAVGMLCYCAHYLDEVSWDAVDGGLRVRTIGWLRAVEYRIDAKDVASASEVRDRFDARMPLSDGATINAPWLSIRLKGGLPWLILDEQGIFTQDPAQLALLRQTLGQ